MDQPLSVDGWTDTAISSKLYEGHLIFSAHSVHYLQDGLLWMALFPTPEAKEGGEKNILSTWGGLSWIILSDAARELVQP